MISGRIRVFIALPSWKIYKKKKRKKKATFFIIIKSSPGHKKKYNQSENHKSSRLSNTTAFKTDLRDWSSGYVFASVCPVHRSADQQVISINPGRYQKQSKFKCGNYSTSQTTPLTNKDQKKPTALSLSQLDAVSLRGLCRFVLKD